MYIESISNKLKAQYEPEFQDAVAKRDATNDTQEKERWQKKVDEAWDKMYDNSGYFRDSYNSTSIMAQLGLSWWSNVGEMLDKKGYLRVPAIRLLYEMISNAEFNLPTEEELRDNNCQINEENTVESWHKYYQEKRERLLHFLDTALRLEEPIYCSL